jgi:uncharacterized protein with HEPN domain
VTQDRRGDLQRLADILTAAAKIRDFTRPGREAFLGSEVTQDAVVRNFEVIGEAAGKLSEGLRREHPAVPWSRMRGLASFAKHEDWTVDPRRLWAAIEALPAIEASVSKIRAARLEK